MDANDAEQRLATARSIGRRSARRGAFAAAVAGAALVTALGAVVDLEMLWLLALVALGFIGLAVIRPVRLRLDGSDRIGIVLLIAAVAAAVVANLLVQLLARSQDWLAPNTLAGLASAVLVLAAFQPALRRLASGGPDSAVTGRDRA